MRKSAYDVVHYPSKPFLQCHPERLAVMARLFGLVPTRPGRAKVLEIGCGDGLNLIAAATVLPGAHFTGIDLSGSAILRGRKVVRELGIRNVGLTREDLRVLQGLRRKFDYVVAHGLYSWIPAELRNSLLAGIRHVLSPTGVAFVSYNAYPGSYSRQIVRNMVRGLSIPVARERLREISAEVSGSALYQATVRDECADMLRREDGALFHDDLAAINEPFHFREFLGHAGAHGLQFVSEADLGSTPSSTGRGRIEAEQDADFREGRRFRQTILCHAGQNVRGEPSPEAVEDCYAGGPVSQGSASSGGTVEYVSAIGGRWRTNNPEDCAMLDRIASAWPAYVPVSGFDPLPLFAARMIDLRTSPPPVAKEIGVRPPASSLARLQSAAGAAPTNLHHFEVATESDSLRHVLALCDGTRTRAGLIRDLQKVYPQETKENVAVAVDTHLEDLLRYALLMPTSF